MANEFFTKAGPITVRDIKTGKVIRVDKPLTQNEVKRVVNGDKPHENSISIRIKDDPELSALYNKNMEKYYADFEARKAQDSRGINATDLRQEGGFSILEVQDEGDKDA